MSLFGDQLYFKARFGTLALLYMYQAVNRTWYMLYIRVQEDFYFSSGYFPLQIPTLQQKKRWPFSNI